MPGRAVNCEGSKKRSSVENMLMEVPRDQEHEREEVSVDVMGGWGSNRASSKSIKSWILCLRTQ